MVYMQPLDALVVGAGFSGVFMLNSLRSHGFSVKIFEAGSDYGGVWFWNSYPGARVDSDFSIYQFSDPKLYKDFDFSVRFPSRDEVLSYFHHVDEVLDLSKDVQFNTEVKSAEFHGESNTWKVESTAGTTWCRHLILCTGFASKPYTPSIQGMDQFQGEIFHSSRWPQDRQVKFSGKRVAVVGTGASGVQIIQEIGPKVKHLTVYQRTPNTVHPMRQCSLPHPSQPSKKDFDSVFAFARTTFSGLSYDMPKTNAMDATPEERRAFFESIWATGGLRFFCGNYPDVLTSKEANDIAYAFWAEKTRERIRDDKKKDLLAPLTPPHPINTKNPSLDNNYYEVLNQDNADIIDVNISPIVEITKTGIKTEKEGEVNVDIIVFATGFDANTGGILNIAMKNMQSGQTIKEKWNQGTSTLFGLATAGFPNMFFLYGPQSGSGISNGPTYAEVQGEWLTRLLVSMKESGKVSVEANEESEKTWTDLVTQIWNSTLFPQAKSWYQGSNIPGKRVEALNFAGGLVSYQKSINDCELNNYAGFTLQ